MTARKPLVIGSSGRQQQIQATDTVLTPAATTANASANVPHGTAPTSPVNGDIWSTSAGFFVRVNGVTVGPLGGGSSSVTISTTAPSSPSAGDLWFNDNDVANGGRGKIWFVGASSSAWIDFSPAIPGPQGIQGPAGATGGTQAIDFIWPGHL
jgi:hypothetical protein